MSHPKTQPCPECGGRMVHARRADTVSYRSASRTVRVLGWWCEACGEAILAGPALRAREQAFATLKAEVEQVMAPAEVASVRELLGLSQRKAGELLGGGPRAFQKYESGEQAVSVPMTRLLTLLANEPSRLRELMKGNQAKTKTRRRTTPVTRDSGALTARDGAAVREGGRKSRSG